MSVTRELLNRAKNMGRLGPKADGWPAVMSELHDAYIALLDERDRLKSQLTELGEENELIKKAIQDEPELPGDMPDSIYGLCRENKKEMEEVLRSVVRATKYNILKKAGINQC